MCIWNVPWQLGVDQKELQTPRRGLFKNDGSCPTEVKTTKHHNRSLYYFLQFLWASCFLAKKPYHGQFSIIRLRHSLLFSDAPKSGRFPMESPRLSCLCSPFQTCPFSFNVFSKDLIHQFQMIRCFFQGFNPVSDDQMIR